MTQSVSIRLDDEVLNKLDMLTKTTERSRAWLMAHAVEQYDEWETRVEGSTVVAVDGDGCEPVAERHSKHDRLPPSSWTRLL